MSLKIDKITITIALIGIFGINFGLSYNSVVSAENKGNYFEEPSTAKKLSIDTLVVEIKPLLLEKCELEDKKNDFWLSDYQNSESTIYYFSFEASSSSKGLPIYITMIKLKLVVFGCYENEIRDLFLLITISVLLV